jgi:hypothetical protein
MRCSIALFVVFLLATTAFANEAWEKRLRVAMDKAEAEAATLDDGKAVKNTPLEARIQALHARVTAMEKARGLPTPALVVESEDASSRLQVLSKAVITLSARLRKVKLHDSPPDVTPSQPTPPAKGGKAAEPEGPVEWPEVLKVNATASVDYESVGEWAYRMLYPTIYDQPEYRLVGYEGRFHFSLRLVGLKEEVRSALIVVIVKGGTSPFRFTEKPRYEFEWKAGNRRMWNGALKQMVNFDTWTQAVTPRWGGFKGKGALRPRVVAYVSELTTKEGRVIEFEVPK